MSNTPYFLWNFHLKVNQITLNHSAYTSFSPTPYKYEQRFFWKAQTPTIICQFFNQIIIQSHYTKEKNKDYYFMLPSNENIKLRKNQIHHKPTISYDGPMLVFTSKKKYHLSTNQAQINQLLSINPPQIPQSDQIYKETIFSLVPTIKVKKHRVIFYPLQHIDLQVEFAHLIIHETTYYSCVVEASCPLLVEQVVHDLQIKQSPMSYMEFLRSLKQTT